LNAEVKMILFPAGYYPLKTGYFRDVVKHKLQRYRCKSWLVNADEWREKTVLWQEINKISPK